MSVYLDASIPVSLFTIDTLTARADAVLRARPPLLMVSNLAAAEFASATTRRVRMQLITAQEAHAAFSTFDARIARTTTPLLIASAHSPLRAGFLRRLNLTLRTQDALHIAIAQRVGAELLTFDRQMANAARAGQRAQSTVSYSAAAGAGSAPASGLVRRRASSAGWSRMWCIGTPGACPDRRSDTPSAPSAPPRGIRKGSA